MSPSKNPHNGANWVDRGESDLPQLAATMRHFFGLGAGVADERLEAAALDIRGIVLADATDSHVSGYLRQLGEELGIDENGLPPRRLAAVALWSIAKLAIVRDDAVRALNGRPAAATPASPPLSDWLASRLLSPEELETWKRERDAQEDLSD